MIIQKKIEWKVLGTNPFIYRLGVPILKFWFLLFMTHPTGQALASDSCMVNNSGLSQIKEDNKGWWILSVEHFSNPLENMNIKFIHDPLQR